MATIFGILMALAGLAGLMLTSGDVAMLVSMGDLLIGLLLVVLDNS